MDITIRMSILWGIFLTLGRVHGTEPIVEWQSEQVTIYDHEQQATLYLSVTLPMSREVTIGLLSYGVGLSVDDDVTVPDTAIVPPGKYTGNVTVSLNDAAVGGESENGYRKLRVRLSEVLNGSVVLGGYGHREIMDVNILGATTPVAGLKCHSGSFRTNRVIVSEGDGAATLTFVINEPYPHDVDFGFRVDLEWTGTTSHALHEIDYAYHVTHGREGEYKYVTLRAGDTSVDISINIIDDDISEDTEQFMVQMEYGEILSPFINILGDTVIVDIVDNDRCPEPADAQYYGGSCYFKVTPPGSGDPLLHANDAAGLCAEHGGFLAIIESEVENNIVGGAAGREEAWIGLIRDPENTETFIWPDGSPLTFAAWRKREPNNRRGDEYCVKTNYVRLGLWNDTPCGRDRDVSAGVCEKPAILGTASFVPVHPE